MRLSVPLDAAWQRPHDRQTITVLLADDHALVRRGFRRLLEDDPTIAVVGEASNGDGGDPPGRRAEAAGVVMDCAMPGTSGLAATRAILAARSRTRAS